VESLQSQAEVRNIYLEFDRSKLKLKPLSSRVNKLSLSNILALESSRTVPGTFKTVAGKMAAAQKHKSSVILMMGAHVLRSGVQRYIIDLIEKGLIQCIAMNGAGAIHDFEFALAGATTECVESYIRNGSFGLWRETGQINDIVNSAASKNEGLGEAIGKAITQQRFAYRDISVLSAAYRVGIPVTVHVGIGYDIIHEFPNCNGQAFGATSYKDFL